VLLNTLLNCHSSNASASSQHTAHQHTVPMPSISDIGRQRLYNCSTSFVVCQTIKCCTCGLYLSSVITDPFAGSYLMMQHNRLAVINYHSAICRLF